MYQSWTYNPGPRHHLGWNRKAKKDDAYLGDFKPTGKRARR